MKNLFILIAMFIFIPISAQQHLSVGFDPGCLDDGIDLNAKFNINKTEGVEYGLAAEYFRNIQYFAWGGYYDRVLIGTNNRDFGFQALLGVEVNLIHRWVDTPIYLPIASAAQGREIYTDSGHGHGGWKSIGANATLRYNFTRKIGIEFIANWKLRDDEKEIYPTDKEARSNGLSGRANLVILL